MSVENALVVVDDVMRAIAAEQRRRAPPRSLHEPYYLILIG